MGVPGKPLTDDEIKELLRLRAEARLSKRATAKALQISKRTVEKFAPAWLVRAWASRISEVRPQENLEKVAPTVEE